MASGAKRGSLMKYRKEDHRKRIIFAHILIFFFGLIDLYVKALVIYKKYNAYHP